MSFFFCFFFEEETNVGGCSHQNLSPSPVPMPARVPTWVAYQINQGPATANACPASVPAPSVLAEIQNALCREPPGPARIEAAIEVTPAAAAPAAGSSVQALAHTWSMIETAANARPLPICNGIGAVPLRHLVHTHHHCYCRHVCNVSNERS